MHKCARNYNDRDNATGGGYRSELKLGNLAARRFHSRLPQNCCRNGKSSKGKGIDEGIVKQNDVGTLLTRGCTETLCSRGKLECDNERIHVAGRTRKN